MKSTLSVYGSHDSAVTFLDKSGDIITLEYERFVRQRYAAMSQGMRSREGLGTSETSLRDFFTHVKSHLRSEIDLILFNELNDEDLKLLDELFPKATFKKSEHHASHAACGFYQSEFDEALIFSIDGGGNDADGVTTTKLFAADNQGISSLTKYDINLGVAYGNIGCPISEINPGPDCNSHSLVYAGKVMGLCAYGKAREEWLDPMREFYRGAYPISRLGEKIQLNLSFNSLSGQDSYDLAATSQYVFEELALGVISPLVDQSNKDVVLVGGCALNVLFNQRLAEYLAPRGLKLFVPPNPNDCGLSLGQFLLEHPQKISNVVYNGFDLLDKESLETLATQRGARRVSVSETVDLLKEGKLIGLVQGRSEIGPRALGNRSIICDPSFPDIKNILNSKVKFREWYRPFAPSSRLEDADTYFDKVFESPYMSFAPKVLPRYEQALKAVTHVDSTTRLQTVTREQNALFYDILSELHDRGAVAVILNTSFNIRGNPILTTVEDALYVLDNTELDCVLIEDYLFE